jgi:NTE family protein
MDAILQERLVNWGYAICDAAIRRYVDTTIAPPLGFPYPSAGVG